MLAGARRQGLGTLQGSHQIVGKFKSLESQIQGTFTKLTTQIASKVNQAVAAADKLLAEVRERNKGFLDQALAALGNTITTFLELKAKLESAFAAAKDVVLQILADPITFAKNLFEGIVQGFKNFGKNILSHLGHGVIEWLTGAVSQAGIVMPEKLDGERILSLFLQITGLSIEHVKERARVIWGDKVVDFIEKVVTGVQAGVAGAEKAIELFQVLRTEGIAGLVRLLKEKIIALKDQALDSIKSALAIEVVAAAIQNLLSLLTPASALIQAVIKIVNVVLFFIQNASRISELVNTIAGGARDVLAGNISGLAAKVESALGRTIPIVIDFLAALIGIGSRIVNSIRKAIEFVRGAVDKVIDTVLTFLKKLLEPIILRIAQAFGMGPKPATAAGAGAPAPSPSPPGPQTPAAQPEAPGPPGSMTHSQIAEAIANALDEPTSSNDPAQAISEKEAQAAVLHTHTHTHTHTVQESRKARIDAQDQYRQILQ